ncbi:hypothetical protein HCQ94_05920 [Actinomyces sp. zg-332]|uniref:MinD/ParA family protein n=1 Tax=Actinomyces sp. zg-332 TaxID=2708340 RepID=UPI00141F5BC1|nr:MinD/ParA family protein [Actinomyces sp. zg-332]QPK94095.1 hypothetical protein HCQ94_05920 [Actinomyces sp. zg-332]
MYPFQSGKNIFWKITVNRNELLNKNNIYECSQSFFLPKHDKELLLFITELKNAYYKNKISNNSSSYIGKLNLLKANYKENIIFFSSTNTSLTNSFLCLEVAKFLADYDKRVCLLDLTVSNEIASLLGVKYKFSLSDLIDEYAIIDFENFFHTSIKYTSDKSDKGEIYIVGNNNICDNSIQNINATNKNFFTRLYEYVDYVLVNTGIYDTTISILSKQHKVILSVSDEFLSISHTEQILSDTENNSFSLFVSYAKENKSSNLLKILSKTVNKPLICFEATNMEKWKFTENIPDKKLHNTMYLKFHKSIKYCNEKTSKNTLNCNKTLLLKKIYNYTNDLSKQYKCTDPFINENRFSKKEKLYAQICNL